MLVILLRANNFGEAFVQGAITFILLSAVVGIVLNLRQALSKKKKETRSAKNNSLSSKIEVDENLPESGFIDLTHQPKSNRTKLDKNESVEQRLYNYFFSHLNKGYARLILVGSIIIPLILGFYSMILQMIYQ